MNTVKLVNYTKLIVHSGKKAKAVVAVLNSLIRTQSLLHVIAKLDFAEFRDSQIKNFN